MENFRNPSRRAVHAEAAGDQSGLRRSQSDSQSPAYDVGLDTTLYRKGDAITTVVIRPQPDLKTFCIFKCKLFLNLASGLLSLASLFTVLQLPNCLTRHPTLPMLRCARAMYVSSVSSDLSLRILPTKGGAAPKIF